MKDLTLLLSQLAEKLGTTTEYLWAVLIKQAGICIIQDCFFIVISILFIIGYILYVKYFIKNYQKLYDNDEEYGHGVITVILGCIAIIAIFVIMVGVEEIITCVYNPEYWALNQILK